MMNRSELLTEGRLAESMELDRMPIDRAVALMNAQDAIAVAAVGEQRENIVAAVKLVVAAFRGGGRLLYFGAGSSGRLGVLDASECPPTFRSDETMVRGFIAGGEAAMFKAQEGAEDSAADGAAAVDQCGAGGADVVMGIAAGGTTPFVLAALRRARQRGAKTIFLSCVQAMKDEPGVDVVIRPLTGAEVITGSTRLKAGTATKLVLNTISSLAMVQMGKVYENLMVDLRATNQKLWDRGTRIVATLSGLSAEQSAELLKRAEGHVKAAVVMHRRGIGLPAAKVILERCGGRLRDALV
jgi:N-acetylmuramic acid 6-phosphate etherase